jgi:hypothetical protein
MQPALPAHSHARQCAVCSREPSVTLSANLDTLTVGELVEAVLRRALGLVSPCVSYTPAAGRIGPSVCVCMHVCVCA